MTDAAALASLARQLLDDLAQGCTIEQLEDDARRLAEAVIDEAEA